MTFNLNAGIASTPTMPLAVAMSEESRSPHLPVLDGLRGIAILLVLFHHFTIYAGVQPSIGIDRLYYNLAQASWCGVDLFFVLSGFLITGILLRTKAHPKYFKNFYMRRCLRIFPLYYGTLAILFWIAPLVVTPSPEFRAFLQEPGWYWTYLSNVLYAREGWPDLLAIGHVWSLAVEEQFYLIWPFVILLTVRRTLVAFCMLAMVVSFCLRFNLAAADNAVAAYVLMPARMDAIAAGALVAVMSMDARMLAAAARFARPLAALAAAGLAIIYLRYGGLNPDVFYVVTVAVTGFAVLFGALLTLVLAAPPGCRTSRILGSGVLRFFGRYSYGLYLFHGLLLFQLLRHVLSGASLPTFQGSVLPGILAFTAVGTALSIVLALASWHLWERHFLALKRYFA